MSFYVTGEKNITFLHIPKTAGTSMLEWLRNNSEGNIYTDWDTHPKLSVIRENRVPNFTFTVVRNPWDRAVSLYFYMKTIAFHEGSKWLKLNKITEDNFPSFEDWTKNLLDFKNPPEFWFNGLTQQIDWIDTPIDLTIKYENLNTDFIKIQEVYNCSNPLPNLHVSIREREYKQYYNETTKKLVAKNFEKDIDTWKYYF